MNRAWQRVSPLLVLAGLAGVVLTGCRTAPEAPRGPARLVLVDPHRHVVDVNDLWLVEEPNEGFSLAEVEAPPASAREESATSPDEALQAFTTCEPTCRILVERVAHRRFYELRAPLFSPARPFSAPVWISQDILVFDQWMQPHHGIHYATDVTAGRLLQAAPFPEQAP